MGIEGVLTESGSCLEGVLKVFLKVCGKCLEGILKGFKRYLKGF